MSRGAQRYTLHKLLLNAENIMLWLITSMLLVDVLLGITSRYVEFQVVFADELGKYLFVWLCAIGISAATKDNQHVRLTFIASRLPLSRKFVDLISQSLFLILSLLMLYWSLCLAIAQFQMEKSAMGFHFPMYIFTTALPFGFALNSLRLVQSLLSILKDRPAVREDVAEPVKETI